MDPVSSKVQSVPEVKQPPTNPVEPVASAPAVEAPAEPTIQAQAREAIPEIDQARTANRELATAWTSLTAAQDGTVSQPEEIDWSAWERAERGLPAPRKEVSERPQPAPPADIPNPAEWHRQQPRGPIFDLDGNVNQPEPAPPADIPNPAEWQRQQPRGPIYDLDGNVIQPEPAPPADIPNPAEWQRQQPRGPIYSLDGNVEFQLGTMMEDIAQRFSSLRVGSEIEAETAIKKIPRERIAPPPGKVIQTEAQAAASVAAPAPVDGVISLPADSPAAAASSSSTSAQPAPLPPAEVSSARSGVSQASAAPAEPTAPPIPKEIPTELKSVAEYRRYEEYLKSVKGEMDTIFQQNYSYEPEAMPARGIRFNPRESVEAARDQILADFVDEKTGLTYREIEKIQNSMSVWETQLLTRERPQSAAYGLNARDQELQANPQIADMQARFQAQMASMPPIMERYETENSSGEAARPATEDELKAYAATLVDPVTGVTGSDLFHLERSIQEKRQGDLAMNKLEFHKVGSFTGDPRVTDIEASRVFGVIGRDQRAQLMAELAHSPMGEGFLLEPEGNLLLPSHRDPSGPWFLSALSASDLAATGVINTGHGGYNLEGLAMNGSAHIGTVRPSGGIFGGLLNSVARILPGGKIGELVGDAVSDFNHAVNRPASSFLRFMGEDKDDFATQVIGHQEATTNVLANAGETRGDTFATLVRDTAEYAEVTQVANTVGNALIATGVGAAIGAAIVVGTGAMLAGYQQLQGDKDADGNQGIGQAMTSLAVGAITAGIGNGVTSALGTASSATAAGVTTTTVAANTASTFVSGTLNSVVSQAITTGEVDLEDALVAGALGAVGFNTQIASGLNAVTVYNLGEALADGDANAIASLGTNVVTGLSRAPSIYSGLQNQGLTSTTPDLRGLGEGDEQVGNPGTTAPGQNAAGAAPGPVADEPEVVGPQSGGGPEAPEPTAAIQMRPDALDRARLSGESQAIQFDDGSTLITRPDGTVTSIDTNGRVLETRPDGTRTILRPNGVAVENPAHTNRAVITANSRDDAFAAANALGLGAFEYNGERFHTLREDQIPAATERLRAAIPALTALSDDEMRQLVIRSASQNAMSIFGNNARTNAPGLDPQVIASGVAESLGRTSQETDRLAARFPVRPEPLPDNTSAGGLFNEGAESGGELPVNGQGVVSFTPQGNRAPGLTVGSPEVQALIREANARFGDLRPASEITDFGGASAQMRSVQERFGLTDYQLAVAVRAAQYSNIGGRNEMPVHDILLGGEYVHDPQVMAAIAEVKRSLPQTMPGPDGQPVQLGHAWTGLNGAMNANPISALLLTYAGDYGQVLGDTVQSVGGLVRSAALSYLDTWLTLGTPGASLSASGERNVERTQESIDRFGAIFPRNYTPDQAAGNALGYRIWWEHLMGGGSIPDAMDRIARQVDAARGIGTNPNPVNPDQTNISP